jgi:hypothetical protein
MAKKILLSYDFSKNEIQNARTHNLASAPSSPGLGQRYYDTTTNVEYYWNGTSWISTDAQTRTGIPIANLAVNPLARANHTGTQLASTISDLATTVKAYRHDEFAAPTSAVSWNGQKITNVGAGTSGSTDVARMVDIDNAVQLAAAGIDSKSSVRAVSVANIATLSGTTTVDGVALIAGDRLLLTGQTTASQNGVYVIAAGAWSRAVDADSVGEISPGAFWFVEEGTLYGKTQWRCNNTGAVTIGTTAITIVQFGAATMYSAGNGLTLTGTQFAVSAGTGISVGTNVAIDTSVVVRKFATTIGDNSSVSIVVTHNLNTLDVTTQVRNASTNMVVDCDIQNTSVNTVTLGFAVAPSTNSLRVVIHG